LYDQKRKREQDATIPKMLMDTKMKATDDVKKHEGALKLGVGKDAAAMKEAAIAAASVGGAAPPVSLSGGSGLATATTGCTPAMAIPPAAGKEKAAKENFDIKVHSLTNANNGALLLARPVSSATPTRSGSAAPASSGAVNAVKGRWYLGKWSALDPQTIMREVYRVLTAFNFEWKVVSVYKLKCRHPPSLQDTDGKAIHKNHIVKIGLQLYKTPRNLYVLDVQKLYGEMFLFMSACNSILTELKVS